MTGKSGRDIWIENLHSSLPVGTPMLVASQHSGFSRKYNKAKRTGQRTGELEFVTQKPTSSSSSRLCKQSRGYLMASFILTNQTKP